MDYTEKTGFPDLTFPGPVGSLADPATKGDDMVDRSTLTNTILLLSSEPVVRLVFRETLEGAGYSVQATGDLGKAVDFLQEYTPDLLMIHPYVADIPGLEAAKYLQGKCPTMRVLMVAGLIDDDRLEIRVELQGFKIFPPPFTAAQLLAEVRQVLSTADAGTG